MCSIATNTTVEKQLKQLEHATDRKMIEDRLARFASEANTQQAGMLDAPECHMRRLPDDLRAVRKVRIGRHRVYFTGHHRQCSYFAFYIKVHKKSGVDDDDNQRFRERLRRALTQVAKRDLSLPQE